LLAEPDRAHFAAKQRAFVYALIGCDPPAYVGRHAECFSDTTFYGERRRDGKLAAYNLLASVFSTLREAR